MMKKSLLIYAMVLFCVLGHAAERNLKVMTYNLRFGEHASMQEIGQYIASESPDIVLLQECDWATYRNRAPRQHGVKFMNELAMETGMFPAYGKAIVHEQGYYGVGILSRYPIVATERVFLPNEYSKEQRIMLVADIELPDGEIITAVSTHIGLSEKERMQQVKFIERKLRGKDKVIMAGDMNATPESPEMQRLYKSWKEVTGNAFTFSSFKPTIKIDYIFCRPAKDFEKISSRIGADKIMSDHLPVISEIIIR